MSGDRVPEGWSLRTLGDITVPVNRTAGSTPLPVLSVSKVLGIVPQHEKFKKRVASTDTSRYRRVRYGEFAYDPMLLWDGSISRQMRLPEGVISPAYEVFATNGSVCPDFLLQLLKSSRLIAIYRNVSVGTNVRRKQADYSTFAKIVIPLPPLPEQQKIAAILASVDEAIQATQGVIDQTRRVKEGLLQDLLTRGLPGHTRFKQTEVGEIPEGWEVRSVEELLASVDPAMRSGPFGSALLKSELVESGIPVLGIDNVQVEMFVAEYRRFVSPEKYTSLARYAVRPNDVMITIMGTVGRCCVVPNDIGRAISSKHTWTLTFDSDRYRPYLACAQFNYAPWVLRHFEVDGQGGMMDAIRSETLRSTKLPVPPMSEQIRIEDVLRSIDAERMTHLAELASLDTLKSGLLSDLLTGKVRVTP